MTTPHRQRADAHKQRKAASVRATAAGYVDGCGLKRRLLSLIPPPGPAFEAAAVSAMIDAGISEATIAGAAPGKQ